MANDHYQRVLEQDAQLPAPLRWLTRAMSSWWTVGLLAVPVVFYVYMAHYTIGGRYLWQHRLIDSTQQTIVTWPILQAAAITLALVVLWTAFRRLPMNRDSLGRFVTALGIAIILVSQSWAFRYQQTGVIAVPIATDNSTNEADPLALSYTTRFGDTHHRQLVLMIGGQQPVAVPLDGLPRWNDAAGEQMPTLRLHDDPKLSPLLGFRVRITPTAYLAHGSIEVDEDGKQTATPTPSVSRDTKNLPYPHRALLAVTFEVEPEEGEALSTTVWLPFEPESTDAMVPKRFFEVQGLGGVGLSFRPASSKLPFAVAATDWLYEIKGIVAPELHFADADSDGRLLQPTTYQMSASQREGAYRATDESGRQQQFNLKWRGQVGEDKPTHLLVTTSTGISNPFITAGIATFLLGVALDFLMSWLAPAPKRSKKPRQEQEQEPEAQGKGKEAPEADGAAS